MKSKIVSMLALFRRYLLTGLVITLPLVLSVFVTYWLFIKVTNLSLYLIPNSVKEFYGFQIILRAIALMVVLALITLVGMLASSIIVRRLLKFGDMILAKIPFFNKIYTLIKQITQSIWENDKAKAFKGVCLVEFPRSGHYMLGFITARPNTLEFSDEKLGEDHITVFCPTSPNPTSGFLLFVPEKDIKRLKMGIEDAFKYILSGGLASSITPEKVGLTDTV